MDFIVDTVGDEDLQVRTESENPYFIAILELFKKKKVELDTKFTAEKEVDDFFEEMGWLKEKKKRLFHFYQLDIKTGKLKSKIGGVDVDKEMQSSVLKPGFEKEHQMPSYDVRRKEREKTKGPGWFNLPAPEVTEELKNDLQVLKMRSALDPKHFYKKNDMEVLPKYFQVGRIMDSALDHVNERLTKKQRKRTMVDELLADAEFQKYNKKKFKEIVDEKRRTEYRTFMRDKRQKNKADLKKNKLKSKKA
ncbi:hypothetical protein PYW07_014826 [Mythimna separata]|uniref:Fcf2 pre-rRNA processing C-terminal domain-containing protein n=1 Tax=Mythimna separata TaxID=271217 RepID=A0AAD8DZC1_MYTSE|nr:hypothetical protein PYW07_014826 [Mythimna separata]